MLRGDWSRNWKVRHQWETLKVYLKISVLLRRVEAWGPCCDVIGRELERSRTNEKREMCFGKTYALLRHVEAWGLCFTVIGRETERSRTNEKRWKMSWEKLCVIKTCWVLGTMLHCDWVENSKGPAPLRSVKRIPENHAHQSETLEQHFWSVFHPSLSLSHCHISTPRTILWVNFGTWLIWYR